MVNTRKTDIKINWNKCTPIEGVLQCNGDGQYTSLYKFGLTTNNALTWYPEDPEKNVLYKEMGFKENEITIDPSKLPVSVTYKDKVVDYTSTETRFNDMMISCSSMIFICILTLVIRKYTRA